MGGYDLELQREKSWFFKMKKQMLGKCFQGHAETMVHKMDLKILLSSSLSTHLIHTIAIYADSSLPGTSPLSIFFRGKSKVLPESLGPWFFWLKINLRPKKTLGVANFVPLKHNIFIHLILYGIPVKCQVLGMPKNKEKKSDDFGVRKTRERFRKEGDW